MNSEKLEHQEEAPVQTEEGSAEVTETCDPTTEGTKELLERVVSCVDWTDELIQEVRSIVCGATCSIAPQMESEETPVTTEE